MVDDVMVDNEDKEVTNQRFITRIFYEENNEVIGCEIVLYDDDTNIIDTIEVTDAKTILELKDKWEHIKDYYVLRGDIDNPPEELRDKLTLQDVLKNIEGTTEIRATKLCKDNEDYTPSSFASAYHNHDNIYCDKFHASNLDVFGLGTNDYFGHVKVRDNLNENIFVQGYALSSHQGYVLNNKINNVDNNYKWSAVKHVGNFLKYRVNTGLRLVVCHYSRLGYEGLKNNTGNHILNKEGSIPDAYAPAMRCTSSLYRSDVSISFNADGSVSIYNLDKIKSIDINVQVMWYY